MKLFIFFTKSTVLLIFCFISTIHLEFSQNISKINGQSLNDTTEHVIGFATSTLTNKKPESLLGNFITDAVKNEAEIYLRKRIDIVFISSNAIKGTIVKGDISTEKINQLLPFDDSLAIMEINGHNLFSLLDRIAMMGGAPIAGIQMKIKNMRATNILVDGDSLIPEKKYLLITIERNALGAENFSFLKTISHKNLPFTLTSVVTKYIKKLTSEGKAVNAYFGHRISYD